MQLLVQITCISRFFLLTLYTQLTRQLRQPRQPKVNKKIDPVVVNNNTHNKPHLWSTQQKKIWRWRIALTSATAVQCAHWTNGLTNALRWRRSSFSEATRTHHVTLLQNRWTSSSSILESRDYRKNMKSQLIPYKVNFFRKRVNQIRKDSQSF